MTRKTDGASGMQDILAELSLASVHKLDPCDTSHLSDPRRKRSLEGPTSEVRDGGYPRKYVKKPTG